MIPSPVRSPYSRQKHLEYNLVRDKLAPVHEGLGGLPYLRSCLDLIAKQVSRADVREVEVSQNLAGYCAFPAPCIVYHMQGEIRLLL